MLDIRYDGVFNTHLGEPGLNRHSFCLCIAGAAAEAPSKTLIYNVQS